jgi:hypothetical protein
MNSPGLDKAIRWSRRATAWLFALSFLLFAAFAVISEWAEEQAYAAGHPDKYISVNGPWIILFLVPIATIQAAVLAGLTWLVFVILRGRPSHAAAPQSELSPPPPPTMDRPHDS